MRAELQDGRTGDVGVVRVRGEVDLETAPELDAALRRAVATFPRAVICDLTEVTFFAVAGVHSLERASTDLMLIGAPLHLVVDGSAAARLLALLPGVPDWTAHATMDVALQCVALPGCPSYGRTSGAR